ncbi:hypothetical protein AALO_G00224770 [Alosa alosa]|uniref:CD48 antigen-like n=1 Tax=Alosa alosa TaxID=278164 RepID=A0AAV6G2L9_9TELE|nr:hypothetical protein AALO_G00224770 [Alosa alosa]
MTSPRFLKTTIVFCLIFSLFHGGSSNTIRAATNGNVTLQPGVKGHIDEILWKHKGNKMVEWDRADPIEYLTFKGRTKLDIKTGDVTIVKLTKDDNGDYEAELLIGTDLKIIKHTVEVIDPVEGPKVTCQISNTTMATLHCEAVGELLSYNWSGLGLQAQMKSQTGPQITKEKDQNLVYTCMVNNPVSNSSVAYHSNECFASDAGSLPLIICVVCAAVIVVAAAVTGFCYHYYKKSTGQNDAGNEKGFKNKRRMEKKPLLCLKDKASIQLS